MLEILSVIEDVRLVIELVTPDIVLEILSVIEDVRLVIELVIVFVIVVMLNVTSSLIPEMASVILPSPRFMLPSFRPALVASSEVFSVESAVSFVLFFISSSFLFISFSMA